MRNIKFACYIFVISRIGQVMGVYIIEKAFQAIVSPSLTPDWVITSNSFSVPYHSWKNSNFASVGL